MKRIPLAAMLLTLLGGHAHAETDNSTLTLYGLADVYVEGLKGATRLARVQSGGLAGSRFGVRGREDLGSGLSALFTFESGVNLDDGSYGQGAFWGRQAFVGLRSPSGQLTLGRQYSSLFALTSDFSAFSNTAVGASTAVIGGFGGYEPVRGSLVSATGNGGPARVNNSIKLESASMAGLKVGAMMGLGEVAGGTNGTRLVDLYVRYGARPWDVLVSVVSDRSADTALNVRTVSAAAAFTSGGYRALAGVIDVDDRSGRDNDGRGYWVGGDYRFGGRHLVRAQYVVNRARGLNEGRTRGLGAGYQLDLSKRTALYASLAHFTNDGNGYADRWAGGGISGLTTGSDRSVTQGAAGMRHQF
ncbi:MAG TPA: porin [Gemmatimonadales bacterium]|nr:porin [Gemmatimonadales bacterium]